MTSPPVDNAIMQQILALQQNELTDSMIYRHLASAVKDPYNRDILSRIAEDEYGHYDTWKGYTGRDVQPNTRKLWFFYLISRLFGITFGLKLMERFESRKQPSYRSLEPTVPDARRVLVDAERREQELIGMLNEERLRYIGAIVLGLNDALVEFTGALAGYTFALQNTRLIAVTGLITGVAATLSMAASEYLSLRSDSTVIEPSRASLYTGVAYIVTVILLVLPFLLLGDPFVALALTLAGAILVIFIFTFYISVARDLDFWKRFVEMAAISLGIAGVSFLIGSIIRVFLNVTI